MSAEPWRWINVSKNRKPALMVGWSARNDWIEGYAEDSKRVKVLVFTEHLMIREVTYGGSAPDIQIFIHEDLIGHE